MDVVCKRYAANTKAATAAKVGVRTGYGMGRDIHDKRLDKRPVRKAERSLARLREAIRGASLEDRAKGPATSRRSARSVPPVDSSPRLVQVADKRPSCRSECKDGPRPCPWVSCRYNLFINLPGPNHKNIKAGAVYAHGSRSLPDEEILERLFQGPDSCALDIADRGEHTLLEIGELLHLTRERVRQIEENAIRKIRETLNLNSDKERRQALLIIRELFRDD